VAADRAAGGGPAHRGRLPGRTGPRDRPPAPAGRDQAPRAQESPARAVRGQPAAELQAVRPGRL
jgi:hypothetical protein